MSDGPHRSLPMESQWKAFAERAEIGAFRLADVAEHGQNALTSTLGKELPGSFLRQVERCLDDRQAFIPETTYATAGLERLRNSVEDGRLKELLIDHAILATVAGLSGEVALTEALKQVATEEIRRRKRQIGEHYLRRSWPGTSSALRRVNAGLDRIDLALVARTLAAPKRGTSKRRPAPQTALDDGPPLRRTGP